MLLLWVMVAGLAAAPVRAAVPVLHQDTAPPPREPDELRVHFLPVGTGSCTLVECPSEASAPGSAMVVDCGSVARRRFELSAAEVRQLLGAALGDHPSLVITHPHSDHLNRLRRLELSGERQFGRVWLGGSLRRYPRWVRRRWPDARADLPPSWSSGEEPLAEALPCGSAETRVLTVNTPGRAKQPANLRSLVLAIDYHGVRVVLPGDAVGLTERSAADNLGAMGLAKPGLTVVAGSHHGSSTVGSNSPEWAGKADVAVFSAGGWFGHPRCASVEHFDAVAQVDAHPFRCHNRGLILGLFRARPGHRVTEQAWFETRTSAGVVVVTDGDTVQVFTGSG